MTDHNAKADERSPVRKILDEPRYVIGKRKSDRTIALLFALVTSGGGYIEWRTRQAESATHTAHETVGTAVKEMQALSERITKLEAIAPAEAMHLNDTLKRIEAHLDKIDTRLETKADRRRGW